MFLLMFCCLVLCLTKNEREKDKTGGNITSIPFVYYLIIMKYWDNKHTFTFEAIFYCVL